MKKVKKSLKASFDSKILIVKQELKIFYLHKQANMNKLKRLLYTWSWLVKDK